MFLKQSIYFLSIVFALLGGAETFGREKSPDFILKDLEGKQVKLSEVLKNGPVLIDFWATWCKPCLEELPAVEDIYRKYRDRGLQVIAISLDNTKSRSRVKPYVKSQGYEFIVLLDETSEVRKLYGGTEMPYTVLIHPDGTIVYSHLGFSPGDEKKLEEAVAKLIQELQSNVPLSPAKAPSNNDEQPR